jgi:hypothetical protein
VFNVQSQKPVVAGIFELVMMFEYTKVAPLTIVDHGVEVDKAVPEVFFRYTFNTQELVASGVEVEAF